METNGTMERFSVKSKASKSKVSKANKPSGRKLKRAEIGRAIAFFTLAVCGLVVSLPHLASEVNLLTGSGALAAWFLAIIVDCGMIATKAHLSANGSNKNIAWSIVGACTGLSIVLNSHAFLAHASTLFGQCAAIGFGIFLPLFILSLSYMGSEIFNGKR